MLNKKLLIVHILVFPYCKKEFHVHVDASSISLNPILAHPREGDLDHPISFASGKFLTTEKNYTMTKMEGLEMVYFL
jgi:hypothetical protein